MIAGASERAANASELWDWIMGEGMHAMAVPEAAALFDDVRLATVVSRGEQTADEVLAHLRTTSLYFMVEPARREAFEDDIPAAHREPWRDVPVLSRGRPDDGAEGRRAPPA